MKQLLETSQDNLFNMRFEKIPFEGEWEVDQSQNSLKLIESFFRNPNYQTVYKNFDYTKPLHVWIGEGNYEYKQVGYMRMLSFPYKECQFNIGDYITCIYDGKETTWLIRTITKNHPYECIAHIEKTNNYLKWVDKYGNLIQYRCVVSDKMLEAFPGRAIVVPPEGNINLYVRRDMVTSTIVENQKFIFGGIAPNIIQGQIYQVYAFKNFMNDEETNEAILALELRRLNGEEAGTYDSSKDDLYNNIPDVYRMKIYNVKIDATDIEQTIGFKTKLNAMVYERQEKTNFAVTWESSDTEVATVDDNGNVEIVGYGETEIIARFGQNSDIYSAIKISSIQSLPDTEYYMFNPIDINTILQGDAEKFSIYHYVNHEADNETFRIEFHNVPNSDKYKNYFYSVVAENGDLNNCNEFTITNNRAFNYGSLKIEAISNKTGKVVKEITIRLGGLV